jgi:AmiR/NasT family two-component response regulator
MGRHTINTEEELNEVKTYYMIHKGHHSSLKQAAVKIYPEEEFEKMKSDIMMLAINNPNQRYYWLKTQGSFINKVKDSVLEATEDK